MAEVLVIRHAPKDQVTKQLTPEGREMALRWGENRSPFHTVKSSSKPRAIETAWLATGREPIIDERLKTPFEVTDADREAGKEHQFGTLGVVLENPAYQPLIEMSGLLLILAIKETLQELPESETAVLVSHEIDIFVAEKLLKYEQLEHADKKIDFLHGFKVNEQLEAENI